MGKAWCAAVAVAVAAAAGPVAAQDDTSELGSITCGDFLALDDAAKMATMLELRAVYSGDTVDAEEEAEAATVVTGATPEGAQGGIVEEAAATPNVPGSPEARQRLRGMTTSCAGMEGIPAIDALVAAHADYEPVLDEESAGN